MPDSYARLLTPESKNVLASLLTSVFRFHDQLLDAIRGKGITFSLVELALELNPMQTECVQEALQHIHTKKHGTGDSEPCCVHEVEHETCCVDRATIVFGRHIETHTQRLLEENERELLMCQGQSPDTQVRGRVRNTAEDELDRLDDLMDEDFTELELLVVAVSPVAATLLER